MTNVAVLGYGVVGSGVVEVLLKNAESLKRNLGSEVCLKYILVRRTPFPDVPFRDKFLCNEFERIERDPDVSVVIEVIGGVGAAYDYVKRSLLAGKHVITSNKELVAEKGPELTEIARSRNVNFLFEASVGGGIPIIKPLYQALEVNAVRQVTGILNGTTNYILTKMLRENLPFADALAEAQRLGYAESDPSSDILGYDTCRKICILSSIAYGRHIYPRDVPTEGIDRITLADLRYAQAADGAIKLIGYSGTDDAGRITIFTAPMLILGDSQLRTTDDVFNAIVLRGEATGDVLFYGRGAGKMPTASSVVSDLVDTVKSNGMLHTAPWTLCPPQDVLPAGQHVSRWYFRVRGSRQAVEAAFGEGAPVFLTCAGQQAGELAFLTPAMDGDTAARKQLTLRAGGCETGSVLRVLDA